MLAGKHYITSILHKPVYDLCIKYMWLALNIILLSKKQNESLFATYYEKNG